MTTTHDTTERELERAQRKVEILEQMIEGKTRELYCEREEHVSAKEYLDSILNTIESVVLITNDLGAIIKANRAAEVLFGQPEIALIGQPIANYLLRSDREDHSSAGNGNPYGIEGSLRLPDNSKIPVLISASDFTSTHAQSKQRIYLCHDLSEHKKLETQLLNVQKLESIGQLAAGIAHEINTPIQYVGDNTRFIQDSFGALLPIIEYLQQLSADDSSSLPAEIKSELQAKLAQADSEFVVQEVPRAITQMLDGVARVSKIVRAMKEFSHPGSQQKQATDINRLLESTITVSTNEWKYVAEVSTNLDPNLPLVPCLPADLSQVFLNVIVNCAQAIEDVTEHGKLGKGKISVTTAHEGDWVKITIVDTGGGIPEDIRHKIFDPFFTTKQVGRGSGQGLAIVRSTVVDKHQGTIDFESELGVGTTCNIRLPINRMGG